LEAYVPAVEKVLLVKGKAGMGNRLLAVLGAILYARLTGRGLHVDWSDRAYSNDRSNSFPRLFARPTLVGGEPIFRSTSVAPEAWAAHLRLSVDELLARHGADDADHSADVRARFSIDQARADYTEDVLVRWAWTDEVFRLRPHLRGAFASLAACTDEALLRKIVREDVGLSEPIRQRVHEVQTREFSDVTIGMHIRHSDRRNKYQQYPAIIERIRRQYPRATLFLATDNASVEADLCRRYGRIVVTKKWYAPPGTPLHRGGVCPDKLELGIEALTDLWLLGRCDYLVYNSTSSFGLFASLLSSSPGAHLIDTAPRVQTTLRWLKQRAKELQLRLAPPPA
jgi:hypothetical protein